MSTLLTLKRWRISLLVGFLLAILSPLGTLVADARLDKNRQDVIGIVAYGAALFTAIPGTLVASFMDYVFHFSKWHPMLLLSCYLVDWMTYSLLIYWAVSWASKKHV